MSQLAYEGKIVVFPDCNLNRPRWCLAIIGQVGSDDLQAHLSTYGAVVKAVIIDESGAILKAMRRKKELKSKVSGA